MSNEYLAMTCCPLNSIDMPVFSGCKMGIDMAAGCAQKRLESIDVRLQKRPSWSCDEDEGVCARN
jgi:hypothetical protein